MTRSATVPLPLSEFRCEPAVPGRAAARCARARAALAPGRDAADWTSTGGVCTAMCSGYIDINGLRKGAEPRAL